MENRKPKVNVRLFGAARAHFATSAISVEARNLIDLIETLTGEDAKGARVLEQCSFLHNAVVLHDSHSPFTDGDEIDVLPPFAGG